VEGCDEELGLRAEEAEFRLELLGTVRRERDLDMRAGGRCVEEEEEESDCSSSLVDGDDDDEGFGERGYLRSEMGCERVRLKSGRWGVRGVEGWP
jgi:hypothetical protein